MMSGRWKNHTDRRLALMAEHPLRYLFLEVTRRCNLKCVYCGSDCSAQAVTKELSTEEWLEVIRQVAADFTASDIMIAVTGGEPLLRADLFEIFAELRAHGFAFGMVTNGQRLDRSMAERLVASGIGSISISCDAPPAINDLLRGKGSSAAVEAAILHLQEAGYRGVLEIISTITKPCLPHLDQMRRFVAKMRVRRWRLAPVMPVGRAVDRPDLLLDAAQTRQLLEYITQCRLDERKPVPEFSEEGFLGDEFEGLVRPYLCRCNAGITVASVLHDGRIGACPDLSDAFVQGHIATDKFKDVWDNRYQALRDRSWTQKGACANCEAYHPCLGGALHLYPTLEHEIGRCLYKMMEETAPD